MTVHIVFHFCCSPLILDPLIFGSPSLPKMKQRKSVQRHRGRWDQIIVWEAKYVKQIVTISQSIHYQKYFS